MKIRALQLLIIPTFIFSLVVAVSAQTKDNNNKNEEKEVREFADSFLLSLEKTGDINLVPESFFLEGFRVKIVPIVAELWIEPALIKNLKETEHHEMTTVLFNAFYLLYTHSLTNVDYAKDNSVFFDEESLEERFAPKIVQLIKSSKSLINFFRIDEESRMKYRIRNRIKLKVFIGELRTLIQALRPYFFNRSEAKRELYLKNKKYVFEDTWLTSEVCPENCDILPNKTRIITFNRGIFGFFLVRKNGELRIINFGFSFLVD